MITKKDVLLNLGCGDRIKVSHKGTIREAIVVHNDTSLEMIFLNVFIPRFILKNKCVSTYFDYNSREFNTMHVLVNVINSAPDPKLLLENMDMNELIHLI